MSSLYQLSRIIINIIDAHAIPDIINAISNEIPIFTESATAELDAVSNIIQNIFNALDIYETMFITSIGMCTKGFTPNSLRIDPPTCHT